MRADDYFATEWLAELPRLRRLLGRNGIPLDAIDDVLQEVALRLYVAWGRVFEGCPTRPLLNTVVLNAARDHHRRNRYDVRPVADVPDTVAVDSRGAEHVALARLELAHTGRALAALAEEHRRAVVSAVSSELAGEEHGRVRAPAATRMAVSRARRRLAEMLEITAGIVAVGAVTIGRAVRRRGVVVTLAGVALVAFGSSVGGEAANPAVAPPRDSRRTAPANQPPPAASGTTMWRYDATTPDRDAALDWVPLAGTSQWVWRDPPTVWGSAAGVTFEVGEPTGEPHCAVRVLDRVEVGYRCIDGAPTTTDPSGR